MPAPPTAPSYAVDREVLRHRLDEALVQPLTLIVAPAGAGKSVLLMQWAASHPELDFVWLEVVEDDDDPVRFSQRLLGGFGAINPSFADLIALTSLHGGGLGTPLLEALEAQMADLPEMVIVLDDLQHLSNAALIADLGRLVSFLPPNVHLVLSSRTDLPIAWSRHRVSRRNDRDPAIRSGPRRDRLRPSARAHHRSVPWIRPRGRSRRQNRGLGCRDSNWQE